METRNVWQRDSQFIHPYVYFLVDSIKTIRDYIEQRRFLRAATYLYWFISYLDPSIKQKLQPARRRLKEIMEGREQGNLDEFTAILDTVMEELHKEGYFAAAKHKIIYVGKQKGKLPIPEDL